MTDAQAPNPAELRQFAGAGSVEALLRGRDWSASALGPMREWPSALRALLSVTLAAVQPMFIAWGPRRVLFYNDAYAGMLADRHPAAFGQPFAEAWWDIIETVAPLLDRAFAGEAIYDPDITLRPVRNGRSEEAHFGFSYTPVRDPDGSVAGVFCVCEETTERINSARALRAAEQRLRARAADELRRFRRLVEQAPGLTVVLSGPDHVFELANAAYLRLIGGRDVIGLPVRKALPEVEQQGFIRLLDRVYRTGRRYVGHGDRVQLRRTPDGLLEEFFVDFLYQPIFDDDGTVIGIFVSGYDVTARKRAEDELRETSERLRLVIESAVDYGILTTGADRVVTLWNPGAEKITGWTAAEMLGNTVDRIFTPEDLANAQPLEEMRRAMEQGRAADERWHLRRDGTRFFASGLMMPLRDRDGGFNGFLKIMRDRTAERQAGELMERRVQERTAELAAANRQLLGQIEEREKAQASLRQLQRLEAVGQLTAGVAHDFNNLLQVIVGNVGILKRVFGDLGVDPKYRQRLDHMASAADRGARLTAQLLAFSRRQRLEPRPTDLNETVEGMVNLLRSSIGGTVQLQMHLQPGLWSALVDPTQMELVVLNLAVNARDAMQVGGDLVIRTANVAVAEAGTRPEEPPPGDYVVLSVCDTGSGMSEELQRRVFEPFFTTKEVGKGSGLGLSQVLGFAKQSGGGVRVQSTPGHGTTIEVYLPRAGATAERRPIPVPGKGGAAAAGPTRTLLLVDDDDAVREVTAAILRSAGYEVLQAGSGGAALDLLSQQGGSIDLLLVDFAMPGMNGMEVAREALLRQPTLAVLYITGYADRSLQESGRRVIDKPFTAERLVAAVEATLEEQARG